MIYTLIFMNSGSFSGLQEFHLKSLAETLTKELRSPAEPLLKLISISLLLALSPYQKLRKVQNLAEALEELKQEFEDDRHFG